MIDPLKVSKRYLSVVSIIVLGFGNTCGARLPSEIQKCSRSDPEFDSCMAKTMTDALSFFKGGSKDLGIPAVEPFQIEKMEMQTAEGKSISLNQVYENVNIHGLSTSKVEKFNGKVNDKTCFWEMDVSTPMTRMEADYELTGQVLVFPINGQGKCNVTLYDILNKHTIHCETYQKKGTLHLRFTDYKMEMSVKKCNFDFHNIFPGNEQISQEVSKTLNENSLDIFQEVKSGFEEVFAAVHKNAANSVFAKIPMDELFLQQ